MARRALRWERPRGDAGARHAADVPARRRCPKGWPANRALRGEADALEGRDSLANRASPVACPSRTGARLARHHTYHEGGFVDALSNPPGAEPPGLAVASRSGNGLRQPAPTHTALSRTDRRAAPERRESVAARYRLRDTGVSAILARRARARCAAPRTNRRSRGSRPARAGLNAVAGIELLLREDSGGAPGEYPSVVPTSCATPVDSWRRSSFEVATGGRWCFSGLLAAMAMRSVTGGAKRR